MCYDKRVGTLRQQRPTLTTTRRNRAMADIRICSVEGCEKPMICRGWCPMHWRRWRLYGDPLTTMTTPKGEPQAYYRDVVLAYDGDACLIWPYGKTDGYGSMLRIGKGVGIVSRFVCEDAHGPAPTRQHEAAHSCGNGHLGCVAKRHVSWKTPKENAADKIAHGTVKRGRAHKSVKLTEENVREIRSLKGTISQRKLAARFGVSAGAIQCIFQGRNWAWLS